MTFAPITAESPKSHPDNLGGSNVKSITGEVLPSVMSERDKWDSNAFVDQLLRTCKVF
jgi:hypothetical protein